MLTHQLLKSRSHIFHENKFTTHLPIAEAFLRDVSSDCASLYAYPRIQHLAMKAVTSEGGRCSAMPH